MGSPSSQTGAPSASPRSPTPEPEPSIPAQWPVPAWLALWVDPAWVGLVQQAWADTFAWLSGLLPATAGMAGAVLGWVAPLLWVVWAVVLGLMLLLAGGLHWLMARRGAGAA